MTSTLLVLLLIAQAEGPDNPPTGAMELPLPASSARRLHHLARLEHTSSRAHRRAGALHAGAVRGARLGPSRRPLFPTTPDGTLCPGAFASLGLGVDHAR